eukprot:6366419-Prymnesium_polylepis.1
MLVQQRFEVLRLRVDHFVPTVVGVHGDRAEGMLAAHALVVEEGVAEEEGVQNAPRAARHHDIVERHLIPNGQLVEVAGDACERGNRCRRALHGEEPVVEREASPPPDRERVLDRFARNVADLIGGLGRRVVHPVMVDAIGHRCHLQSEVRAGGKMGGVACENRNWQEGTRTAFDNKVPHIRLVIGPVGEGVGEEGNVKVAEHHVDAAAQRVRDDVVLLQPGELPFVCISLAARRLDGLPKRGMQAS